MQTKRQARIVGKPVFADPFLVIWLYKSFKMTVFSMAIIKISQSPLRVEIHIHSDAAKQSYLQFRQPERVPEGT